MEAQESKCGHVSLLRMDGGGTWNQLLSEVGTYAIDRGLAKDGLVGALLERETNYPTGVSAVIGVAMPHADQVYTNRASMVVATLEAPVSFRPMGGGDSDVPVEVVFLLLMKDCGKHVDMLKAITGLIQDGEKMESLKGDAAVELLSTSFDSFFA